MLRNKDSHRNFQTRTVGIPVMEVDLVDIEITVMQYDCLLFMTVSALINCKCTMYIASSLSRSVVKMCLVQIKRPVYRKVLFI